ncbi:helix-turn-helix transcriptional regulator [Actinomadura rupiterrae]|uniref:helix-turn-helix transcriptional regulator n=1 Tax=Actinomadura rupiterrae TaxID=559627 RepID=UPI0020A2792A|nr:YafY family protein [Actinomadura rupiterrae]MCP2335508.1 putative DNA-binding transcriptional regulator YafY [Actinomadura rupiterrae]
MLETSARLLRLLSLLQAHRDWTGGELAERLGVTTRTVRRDVDRLRELGYPVEAVQGAAGYRLGAGAALPPLLLDDDEAVAVAVGLRTAAAGSVAGIEENALRALGKLERVLPPRLRYRVNALQRATTRVGASGPEVSADVLMAIADAARRHERLRFDHTGRDGVRSVRDVEPYGLVNFGRHWYLVAYDTDRDDWRNFRVDRLVPRTPSGPRFTARTVPDGGPAAFVSRRLAQRAWPFQATVELGVSAGEAAERVWPGMGVLEPVAGDRCLMHVGADSLWALVWMITSVDLDFTLVEGPPGFAEGLRAHAERCLRALP